MKLKKALGDSKEMDRREFLKKSGQAAFALAIGAGPKSNAWGQAIVT